MERLFMSSVDTKTISKYHLNHFFQAIWSGGLEEAWRRLEEAGGGFSATQLVSSFYGKGDR